MHSASSTYVGSPCISLQTTRDSDPSCNPFLPSCWLREWKQTSSRIPEVPKLGLTLVATLQEYAVPPARYMFSVLLLPLQPGAGASAGDAAEAAWRQHR